MQVRGGCNAHRHLNTQLVVDSRGQFVRVDLMHLRQRQPITGHGALLRTDPRHRSRNLHRSDRYQQQGGSGEQSRALSRLPSGFGELRAGKSERLSNTSCTRQKPPSYARGSRVNQHSNGNRWSKLLALAPGAEHSRCGAVASPGAPGAVQTECRSVRRTS